MMMQGLRKAGETWLGKLIVAVLFGLLIVSFAIWGIADIFRGYGRSTVATVGSTEIGVEQLRFAYQNELQRLTRQTRGAFTPDMARRFGVDRAVLNRMIQETALDERVRQLGLAISDDTIAAAILADPSFKGPDGQFNRQLFDMAIREVNFTEARFIAEQRKVYLRQHLTEGIAGGVGAPVALREAMHRVASETRAIDYFVLPASGVAAAVPDEAALQKYFDERKASFRAPEYRTLNLMTISATALAKPDRVSDADARKRYEEVKTSRFGTPEKRAVLQIRFPTMEEAKAASDRIKAGASFESIAAERNIAEADLNLGLLAKSQIVDAPVADAAFALPKDGVSEPVNGQFGAAIVKVTGIEPETVKPYEEVAPEIKREMATAAAVDQIRDAHDKIEDQRAGAKPLAEIASAMGLTVRSVETDPQGGGRDGKPVADLPERATLLQRAFVADVGADTEAIGLPDGGYLWFDVARVDPARDRALSEVREEALRRFQEDDAARQLAEKAAALVKRIEGGETLAAVAASEGGLEAKTATGLKRDAEAGDVSRSAAVQIFNTPVDKVLSAPAANGKDRLVIRIAAAAVPPFVTTTQEAIQLDQRLKGQLAQDLLTIYGARVRSDLGVSINEEAARLALGGPETP